MEKITKILIVTAVVLAIVLSIGIGIIVVKQFYPANNSLKIDQIDIQTSNNIQNNKTSNNISKNFTNSSKIIDSGYTTGFDNYYWNSDFKYNWKTYKTDKNNLEIKSTFFISETGKTIQQTTKLRKAPDSGDVQIVIIDIEPKMSGKSSYETYTTMQRYKTVEDYYNNYFRQYLVENGPYH